MATALIESVGAYDSDSDNDSDNDNHNRHVRVVIVKTILVRKKK